MKKRSEISFEAEGRNQLHGLHNVFYPHIAQHCLFNTGDHKLPDFGMYNQKTFLTTREVLPSLLVVSLVKSLRFTHKICFFASQQVKKKESITNISNLSEIPVYTSLSILSTSPLPREILEASKYYEHHSQLWNSRLSAT